MHADEDLIPLSALQHHLFCPRQCALIHVDGLWAESRLTVEGRILHERADTPGRRTRAGPAEPDRPERVRTARALPLLSRRLGLVGKADCVEFQIDERGEPQGPPRPVEHKRGRPKRIDADRVQLCAQALCLEEAFSTAVPEGELFYNAVRRRERVRFTKALRDKTEQTVSEVREVIRRNAVPRARKAPKCRSCSLLHLCLPAATGPDRDARRYLSRALAGSLRQEDEDP